MTFEENNNWAHGDLPTLKEMLIIFGEGYFWYFIVIAP